MNSAWEYKPLGQVVDILDRQRVPVSAKERATRPGTVPYYGATGPVGTIDSALFDEPLVLLGEDGVQFFNPFKPKAYVIDGPAWVNNHAHVLRARVNINRRFLNHYLNYFDYRGYANGTTRLKLTQAAMKKIRIPIPDLDEQHRIVAEIDGQGAKLDVAERALWQAFGKTRLLEQSALSAGRAGNDHALRDVARIQGGIQKQQRRTPKDNFYPFLRVANVTAGGLDTSEVHNIELFDGELERLRLQKGDLLVVEGNGSASQIGRAAIWDDSIDDCVHQNHLIRVRPLEGLLPEYLEIVWNSPENRHALSDIASSSSGLHTLSVSKLKSLNIPLPDLVTQKKAIAEVAEVRQQGRRLQQAINAGLRQVDALRRSILSAAFEGRLTAFAATNASLQELVHV